MRRFFSILFLVACTITYSQVAVISGGVPAAPPAGPDSASWNQNYKDVYYHWAVGDRPHIDTANAQNIWVDSMDTNGFIARADAAWWYANTDSDIVLTNWISPGTFDCVEVNSPTLVLLEGYTGDGSTSRLNTTLDLSTEATNYTQDDATIGLYCRTDRDAVEFDMGADGTYQLVISTSWTDLNFYSRINNPSSFGAAVGGGDGSFIATRRGSTDAESYRGGTSVATSSEASNGIPTNDLSVLARSTGLHSADQIAMAFVMDGITDAEAVKIDSFTETLMDFYGTGVQ